MIQLLFRALLHTSARGGRFPHSLLLRLRRQLVASADPTVAWELGGRPCVLPLAHDLPFILAQYPQYCGFIVRVAEWLAPRVEPFAAIDVGANIGDTALMLRERVAAPILCIEGHPGFARLLRHNVRSLGDVEIVETLLGEDSTRLQGEMIVTSGSSAVAPRDNGHAWTVETLDRVLAAQPAFRRAKLLKIDTDGYDLPILRGASAFLREARPVLAFEYDPHHLARIGQSGLSIFPHLRALGYASALVYDNVGDLLVHLDLSEIGALTGLHEYFSGRSGSRYADICIFHADDALLARGFHESERAWFARQRGFAVTAPFPPAP